MAVRRLKDRATVMVVKLQMCKGKGQIISKITYFDARLCQQSS